jgi:hypothetical protein
MLKIPYRYLAPILLAFSFETHAALEDSRINAALSLLEAMDMRVNLARTVEQVTYAEVDKSPELVPFKAVMLEFMNKYMGFDNLKADLARIYADAFTQAELEELARFYRTPVGRKVLDKMPELTVLGARMGEQKVEEHLGELEGMIAREAQRLQSYRPQLAGNVRAAKGQVRQSSFPGKHAPLGARSLQRCLPCCN